MKKILMLGWEWPPYNSGGLGTASKGIAEALAQIGYEVYFVLPKRLDIKSKYVKFIFLEDFAGNSSILYGNAIHNANAYVFPTSILTIGSKKLTFQVNTNDFIFKTIFFYCENILNILKVVGDFDYIYQHDWLTFLPAYLLKLKTGKLLISHVHATTYDIGAFIFKDPLAYEIEKKMFVLTDRIITVSKYEKELIIKNYNIEPSKIFIAHNAFQRNDLEFKYFKDAVFLKNKKIVLFVGRLTLQKGGEYFLKAAKEVLNFIKDVHFMIVGSGYDQGRLIEMTYSLGIQKNVYFTGFLRNEELCSLYKMAKVFVMPSISEPFGITALEAASFGIPVILSKNSGVKEVLKNIFLVDFWDTKEMANKIIGLLKYKYLNIEMGQNVLRDCRKSSWLNTGEDINNTLLSPLL